MNIRLKGAALGAALVLSSPAWADDVPAPAAQAKAETQWVADFDKAVEQAKKEKKDLLVDFTGSDWCGWCIKLHDEVFSHDDFLAAAKKDYVLVALDFPHGDEAKAKVPNQARNEELAKTHQIQGFPTVLLMTADGDVYGRTGYQEGGSAKYVEHLAKLRADGLPELKSSKELTASIRSAKDADRAALATKAIEQLTSLPPNSPLATIRVGPVKAAMETDPENKAGVAAKAAAALMKAGAADASVLAAAEKFDPKNELGLLEQVVAAKAQTLRSIEDVKAYVASADALFALGEPKDKKTAKHIAANAMFMCHQHLKDEAKAKVYAQKVKDFGIEENEGRLKSLVDQILGGASKDEPKKDK
jgi:thioredoxin-related protein